MLLDKVALFYVLCFQIEVDPWMGRLLRRLGPLGRLIIQEKGVDLVLLGAVGRLIGVALLCQLLLVLVECCAVHPRRRRVGGLDLPRQAHLLTNRHFAVSWVLHLQRESQVCQHLAGVDLPFWDLR